MNSLALSVGVVHLLRPKIREKLQSVCVFFTCIRIIKVSTTIGIKDIDDSQRNAAEDFADSGLQRFRKDNLKSYYNLVYQHRY